MLNAHTLRNIDKYKSFSVNLGSVITRYIKKVYTKYDFVFYPNLITILIIFLQNRLFRICDTIFIAPGTFEDEKYDVK